MSSQINSDVNTVSAGLGTIVVDTYGYMNNLLSNPVLISILVIILIVYVIIFASTGSSQMMSPNNSTSGTSIILIAATVVGILIIINGFQLLFGLNIVASIKNIFTQNPELDIIVNNSQMKPAPVPEILLTKQVYNIPENTFGYSDAKALCSAYGSRLATYNEVEESYKKGGEWCNYGWSADQMALFPTQEKTWTELQKIEGHENDCGRPGINGGYIANPRVKFGVNCYGYKPKMTTQEQELMANKPIYPKTAKDIALEKRVDYWKNKLSEVLVSPFNHTSWSKI